MENFAVVQEQSLRKSFLLIFEQIADDPKFPKGPKNIELSLYSNSKFPVTKVLDFFNEVSMQKKHLSSRNVSRPDEAWRFLCNKIGYSEQIRAESQEGTSRLRERSRATYGSTLIGQRLV